MSIDQVIIILYLAFVLGIGIYFAKRQRNSEGFFLANRNLGKFHVVASIFSTLIGGGTFFMIAALGYTYGISLIWFFIAAIVGFILFSFAVPKIKTLSDKHGVITLPELLEIKLDRKCGHVASIITIAIFGGFIAVNFLVAGNILNIIFDVPLIPTVVVFAAIVILYSLFGGFIAIVWTDVFQMFLIGLGIFLLLFVSFNAAGGFSSFESLPSGHLDIFGAGPVFIIGIFLSTVLAYFSSQDIFQRMFAARDVKTAKHAVLWMGVPLVILAVLVMLIGMFARVLFPGIVVDQVIPILTQNLVPVGLLGLILAAFLAMANSTADSELLGVTSNVMRDFIGKKKRLGKEQVVLSRFVLVIVGLVALLIALLIPNIVNIILSLYAWLGILGASVIAALFWKRTKANAVFWSLIIGFGLAVIYSLFTGDFETAMLAGLVPAILILIIGSFVWKR